MQRKANSGNWFAIPQLTATGCSPGNMRPGDPAVWGAPRHMNMLTPPGPAHLRRDATSLTGSSLSNERREDAIEFLDREKKLGNGAGAAISTILVLQFVHPFHI